MYHCNLVVHIVNGDAQLAGALGGVCPPENFSLQIETLSGADEQSLSGCDVLVLCLADGSTLELLSQIPKTTQVILCTDAKTLALAQARVGVNCADFWLSPVSSQYAAARFSWLLDNFKMRKDLWQTQTYLDTAIDSIPDLVWFKDRRGSHVKVNNAFCHAVGKTKENIQGRGHYYIWDLKPEEYAEGEYICLESEEEVLRKRETLLFDEKVKSKHGLRQFKTYKSPIFDENGDVLGTVGIAHDVTDLENVCTELEILLNSIPFAILVKNDLDVIINVNGKFTEYFNTPREAIVGQDYAVWRGEALKDIREPDNGGDIEAVVTVGKTQRILQLHEDPIFDIFESQVGQICIFRDVTMEQNLKQQILHNSNTDFLTGLYNRRYFYEYIAKKRGSQQVSLIYVDLDYFKQVNDTYGHSEGDRALILAARVLKECFPENFITRLGGDEFLVTLMGPWETDALKARADMLMKQMGEAFHAIPQLSSMSVSIGIAQTDDPSVKIDTLLWQSDCALYWAKEHGRSRCHVYSGNEL